MDEADMLNTMAHLGYYCRPADSALYDIDELDQVTMREIETLHVPEIPDFDSSAIKKIRLKLKVSQAVFARLLNISVHTVRDWEQGKKYPRGRGASLKLLSLVDKNGISVLAT